MKYIKQTAYILLIIGGLNWGVYGVSGRDLVDVLFGSIPMIAGIIYVLVGLSALYIILNRFSFCTCSCEGCSHSEKDTCCTPQKTLLEKIEEIKKEV
jgi:uncharacterized membrane protein YuzA (DUF378 family)